MPPDANTAALTSCRAQSEQQPLPGSKLRSEQSEQNQLQKRLFQLRPCSDFLAANLSPTTPNTPPLTAEAVALRYKMPPSPLPSSNHHRNKNASCLKAAIGTRPATKNLALPPGRRHADMDRPHLASLSRSLIGTTPQAVSKLLSEQSQLAKIPPPRQNVLTRYKILVSHVPPSSLNRNITPSCLKADIGTMPGSPNAAPSRTLRL